eukprot:scaffold111563_cov34-Attheya_sp.AAC.1
MYSQVNHMQKSVDKLTNTLNAFMLQMSGGPPPQQQSQPTSPVQQPPPQQSPMYGAGAPVPVRAPNL